MRRTTFALDDQTARTLRDMREWYGVRLNSDLIKRSLAIAMVFRDCSDESGRVTLRDGRTGQIKVVLCRG